MDDFANAAWQPADETVGSPWISQFMGRHVELRHAWSGQGQNLSSTRGNDSASSSLRRATLCKHLGVEAIRLRFCEQVHGTEIINLDRARPISSDDSSLGKADGMITSRRNLPLLALSADCPLLLIFAPDAPALGLAHAGWRGTLHGMAGLTVAAMKRNFGVKPSSMWAVIGPSAGACCYQVREDVIVPWTARFGENDSTVVKSLEGWKLNLQRANAMQLVHEGIPAHRIGLPDLCTICDPRFYSYRRMGAATGHSGLIAALADR